MFMPNIFAENSQEHETFLRVPKELSMQSVHKLLAIGSHCDLNHPISYASIMQTHYIIIHLHNLAELHKLNSSC